MGNRFQKGLKSGAMPFLNQYVGNPFFSKLSSHFYKIPIGDFHCGMRALRKEHYERMKLRTIGMAFATGSQGGKFRTQYRGSAHNGSCSPAIAKTPPATVSGWMASPTLHNDLCTELPVLGTGRVACCGWRDSPGPVGRGPRQHRGSVSGDPFFGPGVSAHADRCPCS